MTSHWRHYCFGGLDLSWVLFRESVAMATARDSYSTCTFEQIPIYFQEKSPNLVELSFSLLSYGQKASRVAPNTPGQDKVKKQLKQPPGESIFLNFGQNVPNR